MQQNHRIVIAIIAAAFLAGNAAFLAELMTQVLQGAALLVLVGIAFWLMLVAPFRPR